MGIIFSSFVGVTNVAVVGLIFSNDFIASAVFDRDFNSKIWPSNVKETMTLAASK